MLQLERDAETDENKTTSTVRAQAIDSLTALTHSKPQGFGEQALFVLDTLCDEALKSTNFEWQTPIAPVEDGNDDEDIYEEDAEVDIDRVEEDMAGVYSEEEEEDVMHIDEIMGNLSANKDAESISNNANGNDIEKPEGVLVCNTNVEDWRLEVERVTPLLKVMI